METFDLGIVWDAEADNEFVKDLNDRALKEGLRPYLLHAYNFFSSLKDIIENKLIFRFFFDRSSGDDSTFGGLADFLKKKDIIFINHPDSAKKSTDKFEMHSMFISYGIPIPRTVFLKPQEEKQILEAKIQYISKPFVLKPAYGSRGDLSVSNMSSLEDVLKLIGQNKDMSYFMQEQINPANLENKPAWFRILYCFGEIIPCWWHPETHMYDILTLKAIYRFRLHEAWPLIKKIKQACKLDFFSTEIIMKEDRKFLVVDYVNDRPDMRKKSKFNDGLPDEVIDKAIENIVSFVRTKT